MGLCERMCLTCPCIRLYMALYSIALYGPVLYSSIWALYGPVLLYREEGCIALNSV